MKKWLGIGLLFFLSACSDVQQLVTHENAKQQSWLLVDNFTEKEFIDYEVSLVAAELLSVELSSADLGDYFNVIAKADADVIYAGTEYGNKMIQSITRSGDYIIRVYPNAQSLKQSDNSAFTLRVQIDEQPKVVKKSMHPSWDADGDGINDCENDGSCDHTTDYTQPRKN
ncbi:hypothetical protein [Pseudoalteromonas mariniglutinosa]|uniref:hypothetical protein n=1 Tax=Pseudoalteromonas mariniglutinosa TaxID=206042 RepID=UPI00384AD730